MGSVAEMPPKGPRPRLAPADAGAIIRQHMVLSTTLHVVLQDGEELVNPSCFDDDTTYDVCFGLLRAFPHGPPCATNLRAAFAAADEDFGLSAPRSAQRAWVTCQSLRMHMLWGYIYANAKRTEGGSHKRFNTLKTLLRNGGALSSSGSSTGPSPSKATSRLPQFPDDDGDEVVELTSEPAQNDAGQSLPEFPDEDDKIDEDDDEDDEGEAAGQSLAEFPDDDDKISEDEDEDDDGDGVIDLRAMETRRAWGLAIET